MALLSHWVFQGLIYMDRTERLFKLGTDVVLMLSLVALGLRWPFALIVAHTLNLLLNGQLNALLKNFGLVRVSLERLEAYATGLEGRARAEPSLGFAAIYGSLARADGQAGDIDIRYIRNRGLWNGLRACAWNARERLRATLRGVPYDGYVLDSAKPLERLRDDEVPRILKGLLPSTPDSEEPR